MDNYKITIIMPIYNAEKYLERSINSIINQSIGFENIELILVNDNSTDNSKNIIEKYSKIYPNIKPFHSNINHGYPGYGRNIGLKESTAEYIMFIDNDDEYDEKYCEIMLNTINNEKCDIVCANFKIQYRDHLAHESSFSKIADFSMTKYNNKLVDGKSNRIVGSEIWTKLFKKSIITDNNITFIEKGLNEDSLFLYEYILYAKEIIYIDYYGYTWYRDDESLSKISSKSTLDFINSYYEILNFVDKNYENFDYNKFYKGAIEGTIIRIIYSDSKLFLLKKLCEFEKTIEFNGELNHTWTTIINNLIIKEHYYIVITILSSLKVLKYIKDIIMKLRIKIVK